MVSVVSKGPTYTQSLNTRFLPSFLGTYITGDTGQELIKVAGAFFFLLKTPH